MNRRQKRGCILVMVGLCFVFCALWLHLTEKKLDAMAGNNAQILLQHLQLNKTPIDLWDDTPETMAQGDAPFGDSLPPLEDHGQMPGSENTMEVKEYMGYALIGTLRIPSVGIELPILNSWSYELLLMAPCRYRGSLTGNDLILMGHHFDSHFGPLKDLSAGGAVEFEEVNGTIHHYAVAEIETLYKNDGEVLPSPYPLTLFTCTEDAQYRIVIRCLLLQ